MVIDDFGDVYRLCLAVLALVLAVTSSAGGVYGAGWDQRCRFLVVFGYSAVTVSGQLDAIGNIDPTWRTYTLGPITILAIISTTVFLVRRARQVGKGPDIDPRPAGDQCRVQRPGPAVGRVGDLSDSQGPPGGHPAA